MVIKVLHAKEDGKATFWAKKVLGFQAFGEQNFTYTKIRGAKIVNEGIGKKALVSKKMLCIFSPTNNVLKDVFINFF